MFWEREPGGSPLVIHQILRGFSGDEVVNGDWTLQVIDHVAGGTGRVVRWNLELTSRYD
ncbi:MAG: proprotein convertase P-domain-containing protein [Phycisphaerales bacterium]|nr:proprotein convertase P-domain-containing protein [Phycisphaerales bacterium]